MNAQDESAPATGRLAAVVLAGGLSRRMGRDKGALTYGGATQIRRAVHLLERVGLEVEVSVRPGQSAVAAYAGFDLVEDEGGVAGPAAGLIAAWRGDPGRALLALAVDMPFVDESLIRELIAARNPAKLATAFTHADGALEPLCTIWEPAALARLAERGDSGNPSPRRLLESADVERLRPSEPGRLASVNTPDDYRRARARLDADA